MQLTIFAVWKMATNGILNEELFLTKIVFGKTYLGKIGFGKTKVGKKVCVRPS